MEVEINEKDYDKYLFIEGHMVKTKVETFCFCRQIGFVYLCPNGKRYGIKFNVPKEVVKSIFESIEENLDDESNESSVKSFKDGSFKSLKDEAFESFNSFKDA